MAGQNKPGVFVLVGLDVFFLCKTVFTPLTTSNIVYICFFTLPLLLI